MSNAYVIGIGMTPFQARSQSALAELAREAAHLALRDAGIEPRTVTAGFFANALGSRLTGDSTVGQHVFAALGITRVPVVNIENACTSGSSALYLACNAVRAGQADVAMVVGAEKMSVPGLGLLNSGTAELETRLGLVTPASFALRAQRLVHEFGTTPAQLAMVAVKNRRHARYNSIAQFTDPISVEEVLNSPMIADPITRLQCCPVADGAAAVVLASERIARPNSRALRVRAAVLCSGSYENPADLVRWETDYRGAHLAYEQAGVGPEDVDIVECHDAFAIAEILHYEALGLCATGEGGRLVEDGVTALGGRCPVNTSGGLLSRGHPIAATGCAQIAEVAEQLRGEGIDIREHTAAQAVRQEAGQIVVQTSAGTVSGSHLLVAVGRKPNIDGLNLAAAGVDVTPAGIKVGPDLRSSNSKVYAIGDVAGQGQFTHLAGYHASVIIRSLLFALPAKAKGDHIPRATYTDPEIAQVGLTEAEAREKYEGRLEVARFDYGHNDRAIATRQARGFIKVMVVRGRPVGATIAGHQAGELIATWSLAIANAMKMSQIAAMVAPYPTIAELNKRVAGAYFSPRLFENSGIKRVVRLVQRWLP